VTDEDNLLLETGFNIFIFFYNMEEAEKDENVALPHEVSLFHFEED
jgi:hypothetical protein